MVSATPVRKRVKRASSVEAIANACACSPGSRQPIVFLLQPDELQVIVSDEGRSFLAMPLLSALTAATPAHTTHGDPPAMPPTTAIDANTSLLPPLHFRSGYYA
ncbi:MAG: hypothetical protein R2932_44820 [Caldilineaceae bacterium]